MDGEHKIGAHMGGKSKVGSLRRKMTEGKDK